jgi:hypothetical protein
VLFAVPDTAGELFNGAGLVALRFIRGTYLEIHFFVGPDNEQRVPEPAQMRISASGYLFIITGTREANSGSEVLGNPATWD